MHTISTTHVTYRIRTDLAEKVSSLAQERGISDSRLIEELLAEAVRSSAQHQIDPDDPNAAFDELQKHVRLLLGPRRGTGVLNTEVCFWVFEEIRKSPALLGLHTRAIAPVPGTGLTPTERRRFVHTRIARLVKGFLGMTSGKEVTLPRNSEALIRSYTELREARATERDDDEVEDEIND